MKALSIRQPWASLITAGLKDVENRTWRTMVRGKILIHASLTQVPKDEWDRAIDLTLAIYPRFFRSDFAKSELPRGGIVGYAEITDCVQSSRSPYFCGPYGFVLRNQVKCDFIPCRGKLGFFDVPEFDG